MDVQYMSIFNELSDKEKKLCTLKNYPDQQQLLNSLHKHNFNKDLVASEWTMSKQDLYKLLKLYYKNIRIPKVCAYRDLKNILEWFVENYPEETFPISDYFKILKVSKP